jgi:hypothetical protein
MRAASIMIAQPMALSVAPVADCHESRWPPAITTSAALSLPADLGDGVVRRAGRVALIDDRRLELDRRAVGEDAGDAAVVLVAHHDGGDGLGDVVGPVVERDDLAVRATRVVDPEGRLVQDEERVDLVGDLARREPAGIGRLLPASAAAAAAASASSLVEGRARGIAGRILVVAAAHLVVGQSSGGRCEAHRHEDRLADQHGRPLILSLIESR